MAALNIRDPEAHSLATKLADLTKSSMTDAVKTAMKEAISRRINSETTHQTALRIMAKHGIQYRPEMAKQVDPNFIHEIASHYVEGD